MTQLPKSPAPHNVKQRVARMREICLMFDAQIIVLDELIAQVETENRNNLINVDRRDRGKHLLKALRQQKLEKGGQ